MICSSGIGFDPTIDGRRLTFGFEGIYQGTAVLYDHQTGSLWMHFTGRCFHGALAGRVLTRLDSGRHTTWADWRTQHPDTDVMQPEAMARGHIDRGRYFNRTSAASGASFLPPDFPGTIQTRDARLRLHDLLYGVVVGDEQRAYPFKHLRRHPLVEERLADVDLTVWFDPDSRSAAAFDRRLEGRLLSFVQSGAGQFEDEQTHSRWNMDGTCVSGDLAGRRLRPLHGLMSEWYGWFANYPETTLWKP